MNLKTRGTRSKPMGQEKLAQTTISLKKKILSSRKGKKIMHARVGATSLPSQHTISAKPNPNRNAHIYFPPVSEISEP